MAIFVDMLIDYGWKYGPSCHMTTDGDLEELHQFAESIGMKRSWLDDKPGTAIPHYDLTATKRLLAVRKGAIEIDRNEMARRVREALSKKKKS
jgi:hypothetical protein